MNDQAGFIVRFVNAGLDVVGSRLGCRFQIGWEIDNCAEDRIRRQEMQSRRRSNDPM